MDWKVIKNGRNQWVLLVPVLGIRKTFASALEATEYLSKVLKEIEYL